MLNPITAIQQLYQLPPHQAELQLDSQLIEQAENSLNIRLPALLYHYYQQLGNLNKSENTCNHIAILPLEIWGEYVVFAKDSQDDAVWGIHQDDLTLHNPMVAISRNYNSMGIDEIHWINEMPLAEFLLAQAIYNGVNGDLSHYGYVYDLTGESHLNDKLSVIVKQLNEIDNLHQKHERYFLNDNSSVVVFVNMSEDNHITAIFIGSQDSEQMQTIANQLAIQWDYII